MIQASLFVHRAHKMTTTIATVRQSPFRETEWDRRLDNMLEDLENSAAANSGGACTTSSMQQHQSSSTNVSHQLVSQSTSQSSTAAQQQRSSSIHEKQLHLQYRRPLLEEKRSNDAKVISELLQKY